MIQSGKASFLLPCVCGNYFEIGEAYFLYISNLGKHNWLPAEM